MGRNPADEHNRFDDDENAEYGLGHLMANEEDLEEVAKHSQYRLSQDELEHKRDDVRGVEE